MVHGSHLSDEFKDMMQRILTENGEDRLTLQEIKQHDWYRGRATDTYQEYMRNVLIKS